MRRTGQPPDEPPIEQLSRGQRVTEQVEVLGLPPGVGLVGSYVNRASAQERPQDETRDTLLACGAQVSGSEGQQVSRSAGHQVSGQQVSGSAGQRSAGQQVSDEQSAINSQRSEGQRPAARRSAGRISVTGEHCQTSHMTLHTNTVPGLTELTRIKTPPETGTL